MGNTHTKITWDRKETRIWTTVPSVRFAAGGWRDVAFRIAPERMPEATGAYVVDFKTLSVLPWQNITPYGTTFPTKAEAVRFTSRFVRAMAEQSSYVPRLDEVAL